MTTPAEDDLHAALRAGAAGLRPVEAAIEFLINHATFLPRSDFRDRFIQTGISITDGHTPMAHIDWPTAIAALNAGQLPCSSGEQQVLRIIASLADDLPVHLKTVLTSLDSHNIQHTINAVLHTSGRIRTHPDGDHF
jgi:hypothetical protein